MSIDQIFEKLSDKLSASERSELSSWARYLASTPWKTSEASEITDDLGLMVSGKFIAATSMSKDPTSADFVGTFISAVGETFGAYNITIGGVKYGVLRAGFGEDGEILGMGGAWVLNETGQTLTGLLFPIVFTAENGGETRRAWLGMYLPEGSAIPAFGIFFSEPSANPELVLNGGAESGTANWTGAGLTSIASGSDGGTGTVLPSAGSYMFKGAVGNLNTSDRLAVNAGNYYQWQIKLFIGSVNGDIAYLKWYTAASGGTLLRTDTLFTDVGPTTSWQTRTGILKAPVGATYCAICFQTGSSYGYFDEISVKQVDVGRSLSFEPNVTLRGGPLDMVELGSDALDPDASDPVAPDAGKGALWWKASTKVPYHHRSILGGIKHEAIGFAAPGDRQGFGLLMTGNATVEPIGSTIAQTGGTVGALASVNGNICRLFTSGAVIDNSAGMRYWGQTAGFVTSDSMPYFRAKIRTPETINYRIYAGLFSVEPTLASGPTGMFCYLGCSLDSTLIPSGQVAYWKGYSNLGVFSVSTDYLAPMLPDTDYLLEFWIDYANSRVSFSVNTISETETFTSPVDLTAMMPSVKIMVTETGLAKTMYIYSAYLECLPAEIPYNEALGLFVAKPDSASGYDTYISSLNATTNYGTSALLACGEHNAAVASYHALIKFDIIGLPASAVVTAAKLVVTVLTDLSSNARTFQVYRILRNWVQAEATWTIYSTGKNWGTLGALGAEDIDTGVVWGTCAFTATQVDGDEKTFDLNIVEMQKMVVGTYTNYGFLLKNDTMLNDAYNLHSSNAIAANHYKMPRLLIWYTF